MLITKNTRPFSNAERYQLWQEVYYRGDTGQATSKNHDAHSQSSGWEIFCRIVFILFWLAVATAALCILWAIPQYGIQPETRVFERPIQNDTYKRTQLIWEIDSISELEDIP